MEDELLFQMLEDAVSQAAKSIVDHGFLQPFACALNKDGEVLSFENSLKSPDKAYDALWEELKSMALKKEFQAIILLQTAPSPLNFNLQEGESIRVHVESVSNKDEKIGARYLYIPYELTNSQEEVEIRLFNPKPVAFSHEIFRS